jgi:hypothetical protein
LKIWGTIVFVFWTLLPADSGPDDEVNAPQSSLSDEEEKNKAILKQEAIAKAREKAQSGSANNTETQLNPDGTTSKKATRQPRSSNASGIPEPDSGRVALFLQSGLRFVNFKNRNLFENEADYWLLEQRRLATTGTDSLRISRQAYENVNYAFPIAMGLTYRPFLNHYFSFSLGIMHTKESITVSDRQGKESEMFYTLQTIPLAIEYRRLISPNFLSINQGSDFSIMIRWFWFPANSEIYTQDAVLKASSELLGQGWGLALGYDFYEWRNFRFSGDLGFQSTRLESNQSWKTILPGTGPETKAAWNTGGLNLNIRVSYNLLKDKPKILQDSLETALPGQNEDREFIQPQIPQDSLEVQMPSDLSPQKESLKMLPVSKDDFPVESDAKN